MKSIYQKVTLILVIAFLLQIGIYTVFYSRVIVNRIITEINNQENKRQEILQEGITIAQKYTNKPERTQKALDLYSKKFNANFILKDTEGNTVLTTIEPSENIKNTIEKQGYIKSGGQVKYILYGYFPTHLSGIEPSIKQQRFRIFTVLVVLGASFLTILFIYKTIADPLKKLAKAMKNINYGNTLVKIPYYSDDEFGMLCRNFEEMGSRLKKTEDDQQALIQALSHDLKTPLTSIIGYSKRLAEEKVPEDRKKEYYDILFRKSNELRDLLAELEDYANINTSVKYEMKTINCLQYLESVCSEFKSDVENKGGYFTCILNVDESYLLSIDANKMRRVFSNIINNAYKYVGEQCSIKINAAAKDSILIIEISDNGSGVPEDQLGKIFDKFYRVDTSRSREKGGTGLGLAICSEIIKKHGGQIGAENSSSGGLCIWIEVPVVLKE